MNIGRAGMTVAVCAVALCSGAWADGTFFSAADDVREPNQKALLWLDGGRETLILQVKYKAAAGDFGWVVPVPGRPKLETAPTELFLELARITRPSGTSVVRGRGGIRQGIQAEAGVTVVEELEVGPYEATVLAASDPEALARWLRSAGYKMPEGAGEVLETYV
ncbi:MAG: DUF2330 domain-containing protein, partial [Armatimonadota bacterium]